MQLIELRIDQIPAYMQEMHFLYTRVGKQNRGVASFAWRTIEALHPDPNDFDLREVNPNGGDGFFRFEKILKSS